MVRPYAEGDGDAGGDADALWRLKRGFETGLGSGTGSDEKQAAYESKLDDAYRERWLDWVSRCVSEDERCVQVVERDDDRDENSDSDRDGDNDGDENSDSDGNGDNDSDGDLVGYVFVLPQSMAFVWDAAVLNEVYVAPKYRGDGVADELMDAALSFARDQDLPLDRMVLDVDRENDRAKAFYERFGFSHWGEMVARGL